MGSSCRFGWAKLLWRLKMQRFDSYRVPLMGIRKRYQGSMIGSALLPLLLKSLHRGCWPKPPNGWRCPGSSMTTCRYAGCWRALAPSPTGPTGFREAAPLMPKTYQALVLAGSRGPTDAVASAARPAPQSPRAGQRVPMLNRVIDTLFAVPGIDHVIIAADAGLLDHGLDHVLSRQIENGRISLAEPQGSPSESVAHLLQERHDAANVPLLVTTADHPLLTVAMVDHFCTHASTEADLVIGLAKAEVIGEHYPDAIRTFYRFQGQGYSGCNLFLLQTPNAHRVVEFWRDYGTTPEKTVAPDRCGRRRGPCSIRIGTAQHRGRAKPSVRTRRRQDRHGDDAVR